MHAGNNLHEVTISICPDLAWMEVHCNTKDFSNGCTALLMTFIDHSTALSMDILKCQQIWLSAGGDLLAAISADICVSFDCSLERICDGSGLLFMMTLLML